ncbi:MAG: hypothetical protein QOI24_2700 [Acidobacteriota bacterium]|jgi:hypothetical protein|nr:hypothetical protein [Acidobacteriota bacterium]
MSKQHAAAASLFSALAVLMTWPLVTHLGSAVAAPGDPFINIWILDWDWYAVFHQPLALFHANAFYPARDALAFSENLFGIALLLFPLRAIGVTPIAAYNITILAGFAFSGFAAYLLARRGTDSFAAGVAAGIFYAFVPFRFTHLVHVQHVWGGWLPMLLVALLHYSERPTWKRAALFGAVFLMNGLTNIHWLLFGSVAITATLLIVLWPIVRPRIVPLAVATLAALALLAPFLVPYETVSKLYGMTRQLDEVTQFSATWRDWIRSDVAEPERRLFPGWLAIVAVLVGVWRRALRPPQGGRSGRPHTFEIALLWIAIGVIGSLGAHAFFHRFLFDYVPGFRAIRAPARWAAIAYVGMAILIALTTASFPKRLQWLVAIAFVATLWQAPIRWHLTVPDAPPVYHWLRGADFHGAVLELPIEEGIFEYEYLLRATEHHRPIVNGVSGFRPPELRRISALAHETPIGDTLVDELRRIDCSLILVHGEHVSPATREWLKRELDRGRIGFARRFDAATFGDWLFTTRGATTTDRGEVDAFLAGRPTRGNTTFGALDYPSNDERMTDRVFISGRAFSPFGIRAVNLLFDNGRTRLPATLVEDPKLADVVALYPQTPKPRFVAAFSTRPSGIRPMTDIQVEIIDGRGARTLLPNRFIEWP